MPRLGEFWAESLEDFFDFLSIPFVMFLLYLFWLEKGWQRENWSCRCKEQSYGHWTFEFFYQKKTENHHGQKNHECLGHFLLCVGLFVGGMCLFFSPLGRSCFIRSAVCWS